MNGLDLSAMSFEELVGREWLAANRIGGYASSTLLGLNSRKYHGLLVAAMAPPVRRMVLLSRVEETVFHAGQWHQLACNEYPGTIHPQGHHYLRAFNHEPYPRWAYQGDGWTVEKQLRLLRGENTVVFSYSLLAGDRPVQFELRPLLALRGIHELGYQCNARFVVERRKPGHHRLAPTRKTPEFFFAHDGDFKHEPTWYLNTIYRREPERGYAGLEDLWMPGVVRWTLSPGQTVNFICSTEPVDLVEALHRADQQFVTPIRPTGVEAARDRDLDALVAAADRFVTPAAFSSEKGTSVITAYPWAAPSGRDAMIALPGLLLVNGKFTKARNLLRSFASKMRNGLMPSLFPEDGSAPLYTGADVSLWFVNAMHHYARYTNDEPFAREMLPMLLQIIECYWHGTDLGIIADSDGLLKADAPGVGSSWMDAKVGESPVTPRSGKPVELNALWYNAVCVTADLAARLDPPERAEELKSLAARVRASFNEKFWNEEVGCCFDVVAESGSDMAIRPNQVFAVSLPFAVLEPQRQTKVLETLRRELLTPVGLRTLSPTVPNYCGTYAGDVASRDRAHHQGSAFPWLLGPMVSAYVRIHGRGKRSRDEAYQFIKDCLRYLHGDGFGHVCELFDGDEPHRPGGNLSSALSIAELLRCYVEDVLDLSPTVPHAVDLVADLPVKPKSIGV